MKRRWLPLLALVTCLVIGSSAAQAAPAQKTDFKTANCTDVTVREGQTLWGIDQEFGGFGWERWMTRNNLKTFILHPGQTLCAPTGAPRPLEWMAPYAFQHLFDDASTNRQNYFIAPHGTVYRVEENSHVGFPARHEPGTNNWFNDKYDQGLELVSIYLSSDECYTLELTGVSYCNGVLRANPVIIFGSRVGMYMPTFDLKPIEIRPADEEPIYWNDSGFYDESTTSVYSWSFAANYTDDGAVLIRFHAFVWTRLARTQLHNSHVRAGFVENKQVEWLRPSLPTPWRAYGMSNKDILEERSK